MDERKRERTGKIARQHRGTRGRERRESKRWEKGR